MDSSLKHNKKQGSMMHQKINQEKKKFILAIKNSNTGTALTLLRSFGTDIVGTLTHVYDSYTFCTSPLITAIEQNDMQIAYAILTANPMASEYKNEHHDNALHTAIAYRQEKLAMAMLQKNPGLKHIADFQEKMPSALAKNKGLLNLVTDLKINAQQTKK